MRRGLLLVALFICAVVCACGQKPTQQLEKDFAQAVLRYFIEENAQQEHIVNMPYENVFLKEAPQIFSTYVFIPEEYTVENLIKAGHLRHVEDPTFKAALLKAFQKQEISIADKKGLEIKSPPGTFPVRAIVRYIRRTWYYDPAGKFYLGEYRRDQYKKKEGFLEVEKITGAYRKLFLFAGEQEFIFDGKVVKSVGQPQEKFILSEAINTAF